MGAEFVGVPFENDGVRWFVLTVGCLMCLVGIFGNVLILLTLATQRFLWHRHNVYVASLTFADLIVVSYSMPFWLVDIAQSYQPVVNKLHCKVNAFILNLCLFSSVYTLVLISFNRYLKVCKPAQHAKWFTTKLSLFYCVLPWILSGFECLLGLGEYTYNPKSRSCAYEASKGFVGYIATFNAIAPTLLITFFCSQIFKHWKTSRARVGQWRANVITIASGSTEVTSLAQPSTKPQQKSLQKSSSFEFDKLSSLDYGLVRSLLLIIIALVVLYMPIGIAIAIHPKSTSVDVYTVLLLMAFSNHCINWIIYGALAKNFRLGYKNLFPGLARFCIFSDNANADNISRVSERTRTSRRLSKDNRLKTSRKSSKDNSLKTSRKSSKDNSLKTSRKSSKEEQPTGQKLSFDVAVETRTYLVDSIEQMTRSV
jgi:hypothetical protein